MFNVVILLNNQAIFLNKNTKIKGNDTRTAEEFSNINHKNITLNEKREVDSIQIQLNNTVLDYLTEQGADRSLVDNLFKSFNTD